MDPSIQLAALGLGLGGAALVALADAWLSQSILVYLDDLESNVAQVATAVKAGSVELLVTGIDKKRDRGQNRARAMKTLGWLGLIAGFGLQIVALLVRPAA